MWARQLTLDAWLFDCGIEAVLFLAALHVLCGVVLARACAGDRHFVLTVGFAACLLAPVFAAASRSGASLQAALTATGAGLLQAGALVWLAGALCLLVQHLFKLARMELQTRRISRSLPAWRPDYYQPLAEGFGVPRPPRLVVDPETTSASIQGLSHYVIRVCEEFTRLPVEQQQQILLHELQHFKRRDLLTTILSRLVVALFWPIPLAWRLAGRLALDSERACDDAVLATGRQPKDYAETLISAFERQSSDEPRGQFTLAVTPSRSSGPWLLRAFAALGRSDSTLHERLLSIISPRARRASSRVCRTLGGLCVLLLALACSEVNVLARSLELLQPRQLRQPVATTSDDAEENVQTGEVMVASRDMDFSYDKQQEMHPLVGLRFCDLQIPRRAEVLSARIVFVGDELPAGSPELTIFCQQTTSPRSFLKRPFDISRRFVGDEPSVAWRPGDQWHEESRTDDSVTPELRDLVQQLVDRPDWAAGCAVVFGIASESSSPDTYREAAAFDHERGPEVAPVLEITFKP